MRIMLLSGGDSAERPISLKSGLAVEQALKNLGHEVTVVDGVSINIKNLQKEDIDCVFSVLHGGSGENGDVQRILESKNIPFVGTGSDVSSLCFDKHRTKVIFNECGVDTPASVLVHSIGDLKSLDEDILPCVVKPACEGSSFGLSYVESLTDLNGAYFAASKYGAAVLIESFLEGRELTVGVLDEQVLPCVEIVTSHRLFDYEAKYEKGLTEYRCPVDLDANILEKIEDAVRRIQKKLNLRDFYRFDIILKDGSPYFLEINTIPGFTATSLLPMAAQQLGISFESLCDKIIQSAMRRF